MTAQQLGQQVRRFVAAERSKFIRIVWGRGLPIKTKITVHHRPRRDLCAIVMCECECHGMRLTNSGLSNRIRSGGLWLVWPANILGPVASWWKQTSWELRNLLTLIIINHAALMACLGLTWNP